ncbi:hypothetical protein [Neotabrizicola shimadae]|uniref:Uncharacterized protein n=1 Tax=Neotabrizicola shimadae TaxID=2807096 RepID=A0A8G0ZU13_9RHOB|nr:hypothetical protein [Neotabrizicola shimadae]QYZ68886.1 hypothetical protein JO391_14115 [Neotabrizicola shimadae]
MAGTAPTEHPANEQGNADADLPGPVEGTEPSQVQSAGQDVPDAGGDGAVGNGGGGNRGGAAARPDNGGGLERDSVAVPQEEDADPGLTDDAEPEEHPEPAAAGLTGENPGNFVITPELGLGTGTDGQKLSGNIAAIELVKKLTAEGRHATREEQAVLARYVG